MRASSYEYDYNEDQIDEHVIVHKIPQTQQCPLNLSRFKDQNMSTHRKVLMDLEQFIQESKNKEKQKVQEYKQRQKNIGEIINQQQKDKQQKIKKLREQQKNKIHNQCPFKPSLQTNNGPRRKFNQFIQHQYAHSQKVMEKKKQIKKNIQQKKDKATHRPKINSSTKSRKQSRSSNNTVFERLYNLREKEKDEISDQNFNQSKKLFHPTINERSKNLQRDGPVEELLYNDAQRRQQKQKQNLYTSISVNSKIQKPTNYANNKYAAQKFIKQFFFVLQDLKIDSSNKAIIEYVMFNQLLKQLGFVTNQQQQQTKASSIERALVHDAYQILQKYRVNAHNVCVFLLGLLGIYNIYPVDFQDGDQPLLDKQFNLDQGTGRKLQKHFDLFYRNRLSSQHTRKDEQKAQIYTFQPKINKHSVQMAQKHRQIMLDQASQLIQSYPQLQFAIPQDGVISHTDLLVLHKMAKDLQKQTKKQQLQYKQLQQCTFKPNTISSMTSMNASKMSQYNLGSKKSYQLYNFHKNLQSKKQSLQFSTTQEGDPQCTFAPQINKNKPLKHPIAPVSKQTQETLYRMHKGRQQYQQKRNFLQRGQKNRSKKTSLKSQPQVSACLVLQVKLQNKKDTIQIFKGDQNRLQQIAHQFAIKHNLPSNNQLVLLQMMQTQLQKVLDKIQEDEESEDCQY